MSQSLRRWMRTFHLYVGLAAAPFVIVYAVSTIALNHPTLLGRGAPAAQRTAQVSVPAGGDGLVLARNVVGQLGMSGEVGYVRRDLEAGEVEFPVQRAGARSTVTVDLASGRAVIESEQPRLIESLIFFHKMPGPHNVALRGNSTAVFLWRWLADASVLAILFLAASGLYLWTALRAERTIGLVSLAGGALVFAALVVGLTL